MRKPKTFDEISVKKHELYAIRAIQFCLKYYHQLETESYSKLLAVKSKYQEDNLLSETWCLKLDIDEAIAKLPLKLRKFVILRYVLDLPVDKIHKILGMKFPINVYRILNICNKELYKILGPNWLRSKINL